MSAAGDGVARLRCAFQKLEGQATPEGLWLASTADPAHPDRFQVVATAVGRESAGGSAVFQNGLNRTDKRRCEMSPEAAVGEADAKGEFRSGKPFWKTALLPRAGNVEVADQLARFLRPGLIEEYSVSVDGVRQDFMVPERPEGVGQLRVELAVTGARAEPSANGARLVLNQNPTFSGMTAATSRDRPLLIDGGKLLAHASDPDGDPLAISGFDPGPNGASVTYDGVTVTYNPGLGFTGPDWFTATITDGQGGSVAGRVDVQVNAAQQGYNRVSIVASGGGWLLTYAGIPGIAYEVQRSPDMVEWEVLATPVANEIGVIQYLDPTPPPGGAYYRTVAP